jgi:hypothetical protein
MRCAFDALYLGKDDAQIHSVSTLQASGKDVG